MDLMIDFPGGARVDAHFGPFIVATDQPTQGGGPGSAPTPFEVFLASLGTCAGLYVLEFCRQRGMAAAGIRLYQHMEEDPSSGLVSRIHLDIQLPPDFPESYKAAVIRAAQQCKVKKQLEHPPVVDVRILVSGGASS